MAASTSAACHGQMNASDDRGQSEMNQSARQSWLDVDDPELQLSSSVEPEEIIRGRSVVKDKTAPT
jgi:hypothetical protein